MKTVLTVNEISDLYVRICGVTTRYTFTHPVEDEDLATVRQALAEALPKGCVGTVERSPPYVLVEVRDADRVQVYAREMIVVGAR